MVLPIGCCVTRACGLWYSILQEELNNLFEENEMVVLLNELDTLANEAPRDVDRPSW